MMEWLVVFAFLIVTFAIEGCKKRIKKLEDQITTR